MDYYTVSTSVRIVFIQVIAYTDDEHEASDPILVKTNKLSEFYSRTRLYLVHTSQLLSVSSPVSGMQSARGDYKAHH